MIFQDEQAIRAVAQIQTIARELHKALTMPYEAREREYGTKGLELLANRLVDLTDQLGDPQCY